MHFTYKKKIFLYFLIVFTIFTVIIVAVQQNREKMYKSENFKASLNAYAEIIANYVDSHRLIADKRLDSLNNLLPLLPRGLRVSIIDRQGKVLYDNDIDEEETVENHLSRPEIAQALTQSNGTNIRKSETTGIDYYYDARLFNNYFVRVALPYTDQVQNILKADEIFTYFILLLFFTTLISLLYLADRFGKAVSGLNEFIITAEHSQPDYDKIDFPDTELGEIGHKIVDNYKMLKKSKDQLNQEREKLLRHFHHSDEGICIFSADHKKIYANTHFIQYVNTILDEPTFDVDHIFQAPEFKEAEFFLQKNTPVNPQAKSIPIWQGKIAKNGKHFAVRLLIFYDNSYEITLNNVTSAEKNRLLKQEMTNNIAHELKTPVSSIQGYLETIVNNENLPKEKMNVFLERCYAQSNRLSRLLRDISVLTRMDEAANMIDMEKMDISVLVTNIVNEVSLELEEKHITVVNSLKKEIQIRGNYSLLYSIFRNLMDNAIAYAGNNIQIHINCFREDEKFYYFSFADTGVGVSPEHLNRLFERFYRVDKGRSRKLGGTGLGLAIVKNAVILHGGNISAKNSQGGGLEFVFTLAKER